MFNRFLCSIRKKITGYQPTVEPVIEIINTQSFNWDIETDILIAGFGAAGASAALEAHSQGLEPIILERFVGGGATKVSGGVYYAGGGTSIQSEAGIKDDTDSMYRYLEQEIGEAVSKDVLQDFCNKSVENLEWVKSHGVKFDSSYSDVKTSYPTDDVYLFYSGNEQFEPYSQVSEPAARGHRAFKKGTAGAAFFNPLKASVLSKGITVKNHTKVIALCKDTSGKIIGVKANSLLDSPVVSFIHGCLFHAQTALRYGALYVPSLFKLFAIASNKLESRYGKTVYIRAEKGVILATGGFINNHRMVSEYAPKYSNPKPIGTIADDGSGIKLAQTIDAGTNRMDKVSAHRYFNPPESLVRGVLIDSKGERICNEALCGAKIGEEIQNKGDGRAWLIIDKDIHSQAKKDLTADKATIFQILLGYFYLYLESTKANSLSELGRKLNIDENILKTSIDAYNEQEIDSIGKPNSMRKKISSSPYYAINFSHKSFFVPTPSLTMGGLTVNETSGLVKNINGDDIQGLYAIGRTATGLLSNSYVSGISIAEAVYSGRRAVINIADIDSHP